MRASDLHQTSPRTYMFVLRGKSERAELRLLCEHILSFENRFLELCRPSLLADQLSSHKEVRESVVMRLQKINVLA